VINHFGIIIYIGNYSIINGRSVRSSNAMINKQKVTQCYNLWASVYNENAKQNPVIIKDRTIIIDLLKSDITPKSIGLDLGCGTGILTIKIASKVKKIIGLDISKAMIAEAQATNNKANASFNVADISKKSGYPDNTFDFVVSSLTLCHIDNLEPVYKEIYRVLKENGIFVFDDITSKLNKSFSPKYRGYLKEFGKDNIIWQRHTIDKSLRLIKNAGFKIEKVIETRIDKDIENVLEPDDYKTNYGCHFTTIIKARK